MLFIIRGLPGSGKSTEAKATGFRHYEADMFFVVDGEYRFIPELLPCAHKWCQDMVRKSLDNCENVVVTNTFSMIWEIQPYVDMCKAREKHYEVFKCTGKFQNLHGVPDSAIERMKERWEDFPGEVKL